MNRNDMRSIVYLIIALICFYYLLDDFFGKNKITGFVDRFIGDFGGTAAPVPAAATTQPATAPAAAPAKTQTSTSTQPAVDPKIVKIPAPQPDPGKVQIPQPQGNQTWSTKSGSTGGFNFNDLIPHIPSPPAWLGGIPALLPEIGGAAALLAL